MGEVVFLPLFQFFKCAISFSAKGPGAPGGARQRSVRIDKPDHIVPGLVFILLILSKAQSHEFQTAVLSSDLCVRGSLCVCARVYMRVCALA